MTLRVQVEPVGNRYSSSQSGYTSGQASYASPVKGNVGGYAQYALKSPIPAGIKGTPIMTPQAQKSPATKTATPRSVATPDRKSPNVGLALQHNMSPRTQAFNGSPPHLVGQAELVTGPVVPLHQLQYASPSPLVASPMPDHARIISSPAPAPMRQQQYQRPPINPMSSLATATPDSKVLSEGEVTKVGGKEYVITSLLGQGAYGKVWLVRQQNPGTGAKEFALKVVQAKDGNKIAQNDNTKRVDRAIFEVQVLQHLTEHLAKDIKDAGKVPSYVGHYVSHQGEKSVAFVMSRLYGSAFDVWLYGVDEEIQKTISPESLITNGEFGPLIGGKMATMRLSSACSVALSVLTQLAPVLQTLQSFAFHRDISNHNILVRDVVQDQACAKIDISLIDFGLATSARTWCNDWRTSNICGDPRYWTPGAWLNLAFGYRYLETHPNQGFVRQYKERLDHFSMGILGLETFFALWNDINDSIAGSQLDPVKMAWRNYWRLALETFQDFHRLDLSMLRKKLTQSQMVNNLDRKLQVLRNALRIFAQNVPKHACATLFTVCADLIDEWGSMSWNDVKTIQKQPSSGNVIVVPVAVVEPDLGHRAPNGTNPVYRCDTAMPPMPAVPHIAQNRSYVPPVVNHAPMVMQARSYIPPIAVQ